MPGFAPQQETAVGPGAQLALHLQQVFTHLVVRAVRVIELGVVVKSGPRLIDRIDAQGIRLARQLDDVDGAHVDSKIDDQRLPGAGGEQRRQDGFVVLLCDGLLDEGNAFLFDQMAPRCRRVNNRDLGLVAGDVAQDQRQASPADGTKADHHDGAIPGRVHGPIIHSSKLLSLLRKTVGF